MSPNAWWRIKLPELRRWVAMILAASGVGAATGFGGAVGATRLGLAQSPHVTGVPIEQVHAEFRAAVMEAIAPVRAELDAHAHEQLSPGQIAQVQAVLVQSQEGLRAAVERLTDRLDRLMLSPRADRRAEMP